MADPIAFCGFNGRHNPAKGQEHLVRVLPVFTNGREHISCWKLTPEELKIVNETGEVWMSHVTPQAIPVKLSGLPLMMSIDAETGLEKRYYTDGRHIVEDARYFALLHHGDQKYSQDEPYSVHLEDVVALLRELGAGWQHLAAAYGHDLEEDCLQDLSIDERRQVIADRFTPMVEGIIWACTGLTEIDGVKQNRKMRNAQQYAKIKELPVAAPVKGSDRTCNMRKTFQDKWTKGLFYLDEFPEFYGNVGPLCPPELNILLLKAARDLWDFGAELGHKAASEEMKQHIEAWTAEVQAQLPQQSAAA